MYGVRSRHLSCGQEKGKTGALITAALISEQSFVVHLSAPDLDLVPTHGM